MEGWGGMSIVEYAFKIGQRVKIKELELPGSVLSLWTGRRGNEVQVRFVANAKYEEVYFFEHELEPE